MKRPIKAVEFLVAASAVGLLAGCIPTVEEDPSVGAAPKKTREFRPNAQAGLPVTQSTDANRFKTFVAARGRSLGPARPDPFALTAAERLFDEGQSSQRLLGLAGGFQQEFTPPDDTVALAPVVEPQPYRRLSGVIIGDSVLALIEMGDGRPPEIIRPGMRIPNSPWRVISIDQDKAVLRRADNVLPRQIEVRLESPPAGFTAPGGAPAGGAPGGFPGGPPGGFPGGPPGGFPGGPPGGFPGGPPGGRGDDDF